VNAPIRLMRFVRAKDALEALALALFDD